MHEGSDWDVEPSLLIYSEPINALPADQHTDWLACFTQAMLLLTTLVVQCGGNGTASYLAAILFSVTSPEAGSSARPVARVKQSTVLSGSQLEPAELTALMRIDLFDLELTGCCAEQCQKQEASKPGASSRA
jgi:hypothetical protein